MKARSSVAILMEQTEHHSGESKATVYMHVQTEGRLH